MSTSKQIRIALHPLVLGLLLASTPIAQGQVLPAPAGVNFGASAKPSHGGEPCLDKVAEDQLKSRESALLGSKHAEEHAGAREHRCRVARGLVSEVVAPEPRMLAAAAALPRSQIGQWSEPFGIPIKGVTAVLLNNSKVLFWSYDPDTWDQPNASNNGVSYLWNPTTRTGNFIPTPENIWCGGQTLLSDGRVFLAGGNLRYPDPTAPPGQQGWKGDLSTYIYNPITTEYIKQPEMAKGRWYPTVTKLPNNTAIITSGYDESGSERVNQIVELFTPSAGRNGVGTIRTVSTSNMEGVYPFQQVLPSGSMLQAGPEASNSYLLDPATWSWTKIPDLLYDHGGNANAINYTDASVTPIKQIVTISGGKTGPSNNEWLDSNNPTAGWRDYPKWITQRHNANTVILPDGTLLTVGGNAAVDNYGDPLFSAELYNKAADNLTGAWTAMAPSSLPAAYHSSAILLPDGTVLLAEDDRDKKVPGSAAHNRAQVYSPPYLFKGARPKMGAPATLTRGQAFSIVGMAVAPRTIVSAVLIAPGAVTHSNDMHQRFIKLPITANGSNVQATVPASTALVPPGYYMLFIVDSAGVPSIAKFVRIA